MAPEKPPDTVGTKLKDSCDACSAFKVRCTKEKPICSRCCKMKRSCRYSPARRAGRPHRSNSSFAPKIGGRASIISAAPEQGGGGANGILQISMAINQQQQQALVVTDGAHENNRTATTAAATSRRSVYPWLTLGSGTSSGDGWAGLQPPLTPWAEGVMELSLPRPLPASSSSSSSCPSSAVAVHTSAMTPSPSSCCSASTSGTDPAAMCGTSAGATGSTIAGGVCCASDCVDCSTIALSVLESLTAARPFSPGSPVTTAQGISVADSIKVVSQILICPCSQRHEVAMLAASVCSTLLDMLEHGLGHLTCASQLAQVMQQLQDMACLVGQFSGRYADGVREQAEALVASALKLRLRGLINTVTGAMPRTGDSLGLASR
ncbi:hypothetical protein V2G26_016604 [Clonostachys chloroleuca]